jgi:hypothetical protein
MSISSKMPAVHVKGGSAPSCTGGSSPSELRNSMPVVPSADVWLVRRWHVWEASRVYARSMGCANRSQSGCQ